eukprot:Skav232559  [mRNA]  locus=scaffold3309:81742:84624:- [translate_table: standard]
MVLCIHNRPVLERFRVLCTFCLVFDAIFALIFALSGLNASAYSAETLCYEQYGYSWHNILASASALSFIISAVFAAWGILLHGAVVISGDGAPMKASQLVAVSRYGHILVAWTFIAAVLEAIATRQQPDACKTDTVAVLAAPAMGDDTSGLHADQLHVNAVWQMLSTVMWLVWVVTAVAAAMSSRRSLQVLEEQASRQDTEAQMVGVPVQDELPSGTVIGIATPSIGGPGGGPANGTVVGGPTAGPTGFQPTFQGMPVAGAVAADGVCQGMPVRDEAGNVSRPAGAAKQA